MVWLVETSLLRATELNRIGSIWFSCGPSNMGNGLDQLWSPVAPLGGQKTGLNWTLKHYSYSWSYFSFSSGWWIFTHLPCVWSVCPLCLSLHSYVACFTLWNVNCMCTSVYILGILILIIFNNCQFCCLFSVCCNDVALYQWWRETSISEYHNICEPHYFFVPHKGTQTCCAKQQPSQHKLTI